MYFFQPVFPFDGTRCFELFETLISVCSEQMINRDQLPFIIFARHQKNRIKIDPLLPSPPPHITILFSSLPAKNWAEGFFFICMYIFGGSSTKASSFCIDSTLKGHPGGAFWIGSHFKSLGHFLPVFYVRCFFISGWVFQSLSSLPALLAHSFS